MRVLHTSDLHIGKQLLKHKLTKVHKDFFDFLINTLKEKEIDLLLISGDVFDTRFPSTSSQQIFYDFLTNVIRKTNVQDIVIISGNHDSKKVLSLISPLLLSFHIHVITSKEVKDQFFILKKNNVPYCQIMAVPYLSESDIITSIEQREVEEIEKSFDLSLKNHLLKCEKIIEEKSIKNIPTIMLAHLFTAGLNAEIEKGDGVRDLYVGKMNALNISYFPKNIDYLALGHIHKPQIVNKQDKFTYCGSPINLGFNEKSKKSIVLLEFKGKNFDKQLIEVPTFMPLLQVKETNSKQILKKIKEFDLNNKNKNKTFVEIIYTGETLNPHLNEEIEECLNECNNEYQILTIKIENKTLILKNTDTIQALNMLKPREIFEKIVENKLDENGYKLFDQVLQEVENEN